MGRAVGGSKWAIVPVHVTNWNAFDALRAFGSERRRFGMLTLDPPAFTKGKEAVAGALRGYKEINLRAMKLLGPGGILVTCSCSYHVDAPTFLAMPRAAAADAHRGVG